MAYTTCVLAQVYELPVFDRSDVPTLHIEKVEITKDATCIFCTYDAVAGSWANISRDTYLFDVDKKKKYPLFKCEGLPFAPEKKTFLSGDIYDIVLWFPPVKPSDKIDIIEMPGEQSFNIYGIDINSHYSRKYSVDEMNRFSNMASFYETSGDTIKAINNKKEELCAAEYIYGTKSDSYLIALLELSIMYDRLKMFPESIKNMGLLLSKHAEILGSSNELYALQLRVYGQMFSHARMYEEAIYYYKESIALYEKLDIKNEQYIFALRSLSEAYSTIGRETQSILYQNKVIQVRRLLEDSEKYLRDLKVMLVNGFSLDRIRNVERELCSLPQFVDTTSIFFADVLEAVMTSYESQEKYSEAVCYCDRCLLILERSESENLFLIADLQGRKCRYLRWLNQCREAISFGEKAKELFEKKSYMSETYITVLQDLAWCYGTLLDYEKAVNYQDLMVKICVEKKDWLSLAEGYQQMGFLFQSAEKLDQAEQYMTKAMDVLNNHDDAQQYIFDAVDQTENANIDNQFALASINQRIVYDKANIVQALGRIYLKEGKISDAIAKEKECWEIIKNMGDDNMYAEHLGTLAQYYLTGRQFDNAANCAKQSIFYYERTNNPNSIIGYMLLPFIYLESGDINEAIRYAEKSLQIGVKSKIYEMHYFPQVVLSHLYLLKGNPEKAEYMMSEALDYLQNVITNDILEMTSEQKQRMWEKYAGYFLRYRQIVDKSPKCDSLQSKLYNYLLFSKSLLLESEMYKDVAKMMIGWQDIQQHLTDNDIAIEIFFTVVDSISNKCQALIIDKNCKAPCLITLFDYDEYKKMMRESEQSTIDIVGNLVWIPILKRYSPKNIYFCPDGFLRKVPIEYCNVEGIGEMIDRYNLYRLSSTKELVIGQQKEYKEAVLYGGLDYEAFSKKVKSIEGSDENLLRGIKERGGFEPLPNTYAEIRNIANLLNNRSIATTQYSGMNGTEESFKNLSGAKMNILHMSTHGMFVDSDNLIQERDDKNFVFLKQITNENDPVKEDIMLTHSFLVMSGGNKLIRREATASEYDDGILTASEISQLDFRNIDLVVLSACETGSGHLDIGGVFGLQRGFKKAGVNTILMSLDKVDDEATKILMVEFYRNLMDGKTKQQSLKNAQRYLRQVDNGKYDKPEYWASFIMLDGIN